MFIVFVMVVMTAGGAFASWFNPAWGFRQMITINSSQVTADLTNFPVLVSVTDPNLRVMPAGNVGNANGSDIAFTMGDGFTQLDHEVESYNPATGQLAAWVKVPNVSSIIDTILYMYYGSAGAVDQQNVNGTWDSNYMAVWHLSEDPSGAPPQMQDSTVNNNDGTSMGGMTSGDQVAGQIDGSLNFAGSPDNVALFYVESSDSASLNVTGDITVAAWIKPTGGSVTQQAISNKRGTVASGWWMQYENGVTPPGQNCGADLIDWKPNGGLCSNSTIPRNQWTYVVGTLDSSDRKFYINGQEDASSGSGGSIGDSTGRAHYIGRGTGFDGLIDEVRISNTARSAEWIETSYNNQGNPSSFMNFSAQQVFISVPAINKWGIIIFIVFAGLGSVYYLFARRQV